MISMFEIPKNKKILFFCAHPDDDAFSSGALIYSLAKNKNKIYCIYLTTSSRSVARNVPVSKKEKIRKNEAENSCKILGTKAIFLDLDKPTLKVNKENVDKIIKILEKEKPDIIFLPIRNDSHPTHRKVNRIIMKATESEKIKQKIFYENWTPLEKPNFIFFFDKKIMNIKIKAMKQHKSQMERLNYSKAIVALNIFRGILGQELLGGFAKSYKDVKYGEAYLVKS